MHTALTKTDTKTEMILTTDLAIDIQGLSFRYHTASVDILNIPRWQITSGERVFLQGESGSGKSTLLQLLCGLQVGTGRLRVANTAIGDLPTRKRDRFRAAHIGMVFQQFNLIPYLSMMDNVMLAAEFAALRQGALARAGSILRQVGLAEDLWMQPANRLSIGQQQRVAIARALINSPEILLLDEPTSALDNVNQQLFMDVLQDHLNHHTATTVVFVSHDERLAPYFQRVMKMSDITSSTERPGRSDAR